MYLTLKGIQKISSRRTILCNNQKFNRFLTTLPENVSNNIMIQSQAPLPGLSEEQLGKIQATDTMLRSRHKHLDEQLPFEVRDVVRRKRMIYRSKQRGWLEADILMGSWAAENVPRLNEMELNYYEIMLDEETIDIFNFITCKDPLPDHLIGNPVMKMLQDYAVRTKLSDPEDYAAIKKEHNLT